MGQYDLGRAKLVDGGINLMRQIIDLTLEDAMKIFLSLQAELIQQKKGAAVAVCDAHGELMAFFRTDECKLPSINIAINKAFTAARERRETKAIGNDSKTEGFPMTNFGDLRYTAWGGGVPIVVQGKVIGAVGVSGLPEEEDMVLARKGAQMLS